MNVEVITALVNDNGQFEVVKELTDDEGNVAYELHIIPRNAIVNNAALFDVEDPNDAMDLILYSPYVSPADEGEHPMDRVRKIKERLKATGSKSKNSRLDNLRSAGVHERYHPIDGLEPLDVIRAHGRVTTEQIQEAKARLVKKEKANDDARREPSRPEEGRPRSRRAHISLGTPN